MGRILQIDQESPNTVVLGSAVQVLLEGGVLVFPTETVYGIGVSAAAVQSPHEIFEIKCRERNKAIPWLVGGIDALDMYGVDVPEYAYRLARKYWPGALTLVVRASHKVDESFLADDGTIALRAPDNALVQALIRAVDSPLVTSSANTHDLPAPRCFEELEQRIIAAVALVLDGGPTSIGSASTVVSCIGPQPVIGRNSAIPVEMIMEVAYGEA